MASGYWPWSQPSHNPSLGGAANATAQDNGHAYSPSNTHNTAIRNSYEHNQQTIPGLALSFSGAPSGLQSFGADHPAKAQETTFADVEEGELSEGELEDIYEPQEPVANISNGKPDDNRYELGRAGASGFSRDRSGSYSPYLSPGEMDTDLSEPHQAESRENPGVQSVEEMKSRAQEAILRLRLANVQYQDFVNEGIDRSVIDQLFTALGLEVPAPQGSKSLSQPITTQSTPEHVTNSEPVAQEKTSTPPNDKDKSEERKDRIARLLAAKGSKSGSHGGGATTVGKVAKPSGAAKGNSEKSKLLQKKMEALLKAREAQQQERSQQDITDNDAKDDTTVAGQEDIATDKSGMKGASNAPDAQKSSSRSSPNFATNSPKTGRQTVNASGTSSSEAPFKKPFGQNRETRPFLIDVSDDDDDTDMEIDSPEQHMSTNTGTKQSHGVGAALDEEAMRELSSPGSVSTPTASKGANRPDLASINKKIEAMKLKIAEAEARKKAKLSEQASPADSPTLSAQAANDDPTNVNLRSASPGNSTDARAELNSSSIRLQRDVDGSSSPQAMRDGRSRAASVRLPLLESRRREQLLKLKALQSQVANIERELKEGLAEEERLRGDLDYISDDDIETSANVPQPRMPQGLGQGHSADSSYVKAVDHSGQEDHDGDDQSDVVSSDHVAADDNSQPVSTGPMYGGGSRGMSTVAEEDMETESGSSVAQDDLPSTKVPSTEELRGIADDKDVTMQEARRTSGDEADNDTDGYEPPDATESESDESSMDRVGENQDPDVAALNAELISAGRQDSVPETERQAPKQPVGATARPSKAGFIPYDSPLRYFHAFRFHPLFNDNVAGGLRSATYSNKIDAKLPLCPDEASGEPCPRGKDCHFQHFETMQAPDDQILLQLGAYSDCEESKKQEYIIGLRQLLTDFRNQKVKDFDTISQGIIDYRAKFHGDDSKILPLGSVSL